MVKPTPDRKRGQEWATVDLINESPNLITNITVILSAESTQGQVGWRWATEPPPFLPAHRSFHSEGSFHTLDVDSQPDGSSFVKIWPGQWHATVAWQDAHGEWWARRDSGNPYPTVDIAPGRHDPLSFFPPVRTRRYRLLRRLGIRWRDY